MKSKVYSIVENGSMTGTAVITSSTIDLSVWEHLSIQFVWTGTPNGTLAMQVSNDGSTWSSYTITLPSVAGVASNGAVQISSIAHQFARITYTNSSSTGTLNVKASCKG